MSFVSVTVCNRFLTVMADSRTVKLYTNGDIHSIVEENKDKIITISDNAFITITGANEDAENFIDKSNLFKEVLKEGKLKETKDLNEWFNNSKKYIITDYHFNIHLGGMDVNDKLLIYDIKSSKKELKKLEYIEDNLSYEFSGLKDINNTFIENTFKELCKTNFNGTAESMLNVQAQLNDIIADLNNSVNKNKKYFIIKR